MLVTGGAGYIGSHTCVELLQSGFDVFVVDNLVNSDQESLLRVQQITGKSPVFREVDLLDRTALKRVFDDCKPEAVIHFAGLKAVAESVSDPLRYYHNNITSTLVLCETMLECGVDTLVFSSSATVYGDPPSVPITEDSPLSPANPYGHSKLVIENILRDLQVVAPSWNIALLRYFNPVGAHPSGRIGEDPRGIPNNLFPYVTQVAVGRLSELSVYGGDYPTPDGTGVRDFIHVVDLARGHIKALEALGAGIGLEVFNLGTGRGHSVLEVLNAFGEAVGHSVPHRIVERRPGDVAVSYADVSKANTQLGWRADHSLNQMCADAWRWQRDNPNGYRAA